MKMRSLVDIAADYLVKHAELINFSLLPIDLHLPLQYKLEGKYYTIKHLRPTWLDEHINFDGNLLDTCYNMNLSGTDTVRYLLNLNELPANVMRHVEIVVIIYYMIFFGRCQNLKMKENFMIVVFNKLKELSTKNISGNTFKNLMIILNKS